MAVNHILFNDQLNHGRDLRRCLSKLEEGRDELFDLMDTMALMIDGNGSDASHYPYMVVRFGFADTAGAKAAWEELQSLRSKLNTDASVSSVLAAMSQAFAKFR
jgi:hypothetical protein